MRNPTLLSIFGSYIFSVSYPKGKVPIVPKVTHAVTIDFAIMRILRLKPNIHSKNDKTSICNLVSTTAHYGLLVI